MTEEDVNKPITLSGVAANNGPLTFTVVDQPGFGALTGTPPNLTYDPGDDFAGDDSFTFRVSDSHGVSELATVGITVTAVNDEPAVANNIADVTSVEDDDDMVVGLSNAFTDVDGDQLTLSVTSGDPSLVTATLSGTNLTLSHQRDRHGSTTIVVTGKDPSNEEVSDTFTVTIAPVNDAPTLDAIDDPLDLYGDADEQTVDLIGISAGGVESQQLEVTAVSSNTSLIPNPIVTYKWPDPTGKLTYTPLPEQSGSADITVTVRDAGLDEALGTGDGGTSWRTFSQRVNPWTNPDAEYDVNGIEGVTPLDVLTIIVYINNHPGSTALPAAPESPPPYFFGFKIGVSHPSMSLSLASVTDGLKLKVEGLYGPTNETSASAVMCSSMPMHQSVALMIMRRTPSLRMSSEAP